VLKLLVGSSPKSVVAYVGAEAYRQHFGLLKGPRSGNRAQNALAYGAVWALDNDSFAGFNEHKFNVLLKLCAGIPGCLFAAAPDVVGNAAETIALFQKWQPIIRDYGYPVAFVAQDGLEKLPICWDDFDALFIGGSTVWKLGQDAARIAIEAKRRGKHLHMGRVNSDIRITYARSIGCDSVDGTGYARFLSRTVKAHESLIKPRQHSLWEMEKCS
jgi:hypothetical protein